MKRPEVDATIVADSIARQIEGRVSYRRAIKMAIATAMRVGAEGIKVQISGRVGGAEIARSEMFKEGRTPLHTFRADIDYALAVARTQMGRQKGGGGARHGSLKANIFVGGGRVFGPKPRTYDSKLNKKVKSLARCSALSYKAAEGKITLVEPFTMEAPKTKELLSILSNIKAGDRKVLVVLPENSNNIFLSSRNLPDVKVITVDEINTYAIMDAHSLVMVDGVQDILAARVK